MATVDLIKQRQSVVTEMDNVIIEKNLETMIGGVTLNVSDFNEDVITAGYPVIKDSEEYKVSLSSGDANKVVGYVVASVPKTMPLVAVMVRGTINTKAFQNATGKEIPTEFKSKSNLIRFV